MDSLRGSPPAWGLVEGLTTPHRKKQTVTKPLQMDLREVDCDPGEWIDLAEDRDQ